MPETYQFIGYCDDQLVFTSTMVNRGKLPVGTNLGGGWRLRAYRPETQPGVVEVDVEKIADPVIEGLGPDAQSMWIRIADPKVQPWRIDLVNSEQRATPLSSADARQAEHTARGAYQGFFWQSVQVSSDTYVVKGMKK